MVIQFLALELFNSNQAAVIKNQTLVRTLIGTSINNKMNAFLKLLADSNFE